MNKSNNEILSKINNLFYSYLVKYQLAKYDSENEGAEINQDEVSKVRKSMLSIDIQAREAKEQKVKEDLAYKSNLSDEFNFKVEKQLNEKLNDPDFLEDKTLNLFDIHYNLIDKVFANATTISSLEMLVKNISSLEKKINEYAGKPNAKENTRTSLGLIGTDNLKVYIPTLIAENTLTRDSSFPLLHRKLFEHIILTANSAFHLAAYYRKNEGWNIDPYQAYVNALFHEIGTSIVFKQYLKVFDDVWRSELNEARENKDQKRYTTISKLEPSHIHLRNALKHYQKNFSSLAADLFHFERIMTKQVIKEYVSDNLRVINTTDKLSMYTDILIKANAYAEARELLEANLIKEQHFNYYTNHHGLKDELNALLHVKANKKIIKN